MLLETKRELKIGITLATIRRVVELFLWDIVLSALIFGLFKATIIPSTMSGCFLSLLLGVVMYGIENFRWLRRCRFEMPSKKAYCIVNYSAYAVFMIISFFIMAISDSETYTWLFAITKFMKYTKLPIGTLGSAIIFHAIMALLIWFAPFNMEEVLKEEVNISWQEREYTVSDVLDVINSDKLDLSVDSKKAILLNLFTGSANNDINRLIGLPLEEE